MVVDAATWCSSEGRTWGSGGGRVPPRDLPLDLLRDLRDRQVPEVTCHSQDV